VPGATCAAVAAASALVAASMQTPPMPTILAIAHVSFYAHDLAASRRFYTTFLGFPESPELDFAVNDRQSIVLVPERAPGDRLVNIGFYVDRDAFAVRDPDGHDLTFGPRPAGGARIAGKNAISDDLRHAGVLVGALGPALDFYGRLGFKETWRGSRDGKELDWVNVQVPGGNDYIEFMLYRDLPPADRRGTQHHICLFVPNVDRALATLESRAAAAGYSRAMEIRVGINRKRQLNLFDPDGTRIELMEPTTIDGRPAPSSTAPPPRS
jgi:catechol 2,3-dioxygenase-like lactoylglutathione lyase family enzyme